MEGHMIIAVGFAYDPKTNDWTKRIEYAARDRIEAIRWCNFNRNWMKRLTITEGETK
jgi:cyclopropane fatty-acyl-phospholipid synthase-like methyltransferase